MTDSVPELQGLISSVATGNFFDMARDSCCRSTGLSGVAMASSGVASKREQPATILRLMTPPHGVLPRGKKSDINFDFLEYF